MDLTDYIRQKSIFKLPAATNPGRNFRRDGEKWGGILWVSGPEPKRRGFVTGCDKLLFGIFQKHSYPAHALHNSCVHKVVLPKGGENG